MVQRNLILRVCVRVRVRVFFRPGWRLAVRHLLQEGVRT